MTNGNDPITAHLTYDTYSGQPNGFLEGLTKREYFAARALQGLLASGKSARTDDNDPARVHLLSARIADALIKALNETENK